MGMHSEIADWAIAGVMNCLVTGEVESASSAHAELTNAINTYLIERGYSEADLASVWTGEIQIISS